MAKPLLNGNVVMMQKQDRDDRNVGSDINKFLIDRHNDGNEKLTGTAAEYERDIKRFFKSLWGVELNQLQVQDLDILPIHIVEYQSLLINSGYSSNTINRNINSVSALYGFFEQNRYRYRDKDNEWVYILKSVFNSIKKVDLKDVKPYGIFSHQETQEIIKRAQALTNGYKKSLAFEFASVTSFRLEAVVGLNINKDIRNVDGVWVAKTIDKGKDHEKSVRDDIYARLKMYADDEGNVFDFTSRTLQRDLAKIIQDMNLDSERNLAFHSLKKYGIEEVFHMSQGNAKLMAEQGNHSSYNTTQKYYTDFDKNYAAMPSLFIGQNLEVEKLQSLSKKQLLQLIQQASRSVQYELLHIHDRNQDRNNS